ncbi:hypothetical protein JTB14_033708 [Gonioctena quinquepunctata]|nr:hypothetical protein JTB14_033708 [Gonioctena quinquepunctata]
MFISNDGQQIVAIYVDDLLVLGSTEEKVKEIEDLLNSNFEITPLGIPRYLLSFQIMWSENQVALSQEIYVMKIPDKFGMSNCQLKSIPIDSGTKPEKSNDESKRSDKISYQSKIGSLLYLAMSTRPDITYAVNVMSQFSSDPSVEH